MIRHACFLWLLNRRLSDESVTRKKAAGNRAAGPRAFHATKEIRWLQRAGNDSLPLILVNIFTKVNSKDIYFVTL